LKEFNNIFLNKNALNNANSSKVNLKDPKSKWSNNIFHYRLHEITGTIWYDIFVVVVDKGRQPTTEPNHH
jgi:hypothetical protein